MRGLDERCGGWDTGALRLRSISMEPFANDVCLPVHGHRGPAARELESHLKPVWITSSLHNPHPDHRPVTTAVTESKREAIKSKFFSLNSTEHYQHKETVFNNGSVGVWSHTGHNGMKRLSHTEYLLLLVHHKCTLCLESFNHLTREVMQLHSILLVVSEKLSNMLQNSRR